MKRLMRYTLVLAPLPFLAACGPDAPQLPVFSDPSSALSAGFAGIAGISDSDAKTWRNNDPRYALQKISWNFGSGPLFSSYSISAVRAHYAHAAGLTGLGQIIAIIDSGFRTSHEVFDGKSVDAVGAFGQDGHGTMTVSVATGDTSHMIGIAPGADLIIGSYDSETGMAAILNRAKNQGAVAVNNSWGYVSGGGTLIVSSANFQSSFGSGEGATYYNALKDYAATGVVVFSASNKNTDNHSGLTEGLPYLKPVLESGWLTGINVVPTLNGSGDITGGTLVSAACMEAARWCLAADGAWEGAWDGSDTDYQFHTGTSFVAPQISGALALLAEAFPTLTPHELRQRLIASANNGWIGDFDGLIDFGNGVTHGYNWTFGNGFLDIEAALRPIGGASAAMADGAKVVIGQPDIITGTAYGDAVTQALSAHQIYVTDAFKAGFEVDAAVLAAAQSARAPMAVASARLFDEGLASVRRAESDPLHMGSGQSLLTAYAGAIGSGTAGGTRFEALTPGPVGGDTLGLSLLGQQSLGQGALRYGVTLVQGQGGPLGLGRAGTVSSAAALDVRVSQPFGGGEVNLSGQWGLAEASGVTGFESLTPARFSRLGVDLGWRGALVAGDRLALGAALPLAVTGGQGVIALPVSRSAEQWSYEDVTVPLAPQARQVDLSVSYMVPLGHGHELALGAYRALNAGNVGGAETYGAMVAWQVSF